MGWHLAGLRDKIVAKHPAIDNEGRADGVFPQNLYREQSVSNSIAVPATPAAPANPFKSPSYPARIHLSERASLADVLQSCDERLAEFRRKLDVLAKSPDRATYERMYLQLQGARDQVADAVRRMPLEAGDLYHEDRERFQAATEAFDRIAERWSA